MQISLDFPRKTVVKIAEDITGATVSKHRLRNRNAEYLIKLVPTGTAAPTETNILNTGRIAFPKIDGQIEHESISISNEDSVDVYAYASLESDESVFGSLVVNA